MILPSSTPVEELIAAYDAQACARRHPVRAGLALAPLHVAPEFGVRIGKAVVLSVFARLQVVTGSRVFTEDRDKSLADSFAQDVLNPNPSGTLSRISEPPFTFAVGAKAKYYFREGARLRPFVGGFAGYGFARFRVPMGFSNDRNGNSVPDEAETALHGPQNAAGEIIPETCVPVWPYNAGCERSIAGADIRTLAGNVRSNTPAGDQRIDTVKIGPGFVGAVGGVQYQVVDHFAVWGEITAGVYFPQGTTVLFDLTIGPVVTF
jgi:hypothetical protein